MARCVIVGCGCRGRALAAELLNRGHAVRGTTRDPGRLGDLERVGVEPYLGDPDRVASLAGALEQATVLCLLLGSARGEPERIAALHGSRLEMLLSRALDSPVRAVVYESHGTVGPHVLERGAELVQSFCSRSRVRCALLDADPQDAATWVSSAAAVVERALGQGLPGPADSD